MQAITIIPLAPVHSSKMILILASVTGVASHLLYFVHGEHHMSAPVLFYSYGALTLALLYLQLQINDHIYLRAAQETIILLAAYVSSLFTSITIYRICFHRLRSFPGPKLARVSKLWHVYQSRHSQNYKLMQDLHRDYGSFVRTGPSEITAFVPEALLALDGPKSTCKKADWYDLIQPLRSVVTIRDKPEHDARRRIWDKGFSTKSLLDYDDRIMRYGAQLESNLATSNAQPINVNDEFLWFSFDVMGDLALARSFDMLLDKKWHHAILLMRDFMWLLGPFSPVPWLARLGFGIPGVAQGWKRFVFWCTDRMSERISIEPQKPDVSSHLINASKDTNSLDQDRKWLNGDAVAMIVAGSDTVAMTLISVFYHLAQSPIHQHRIREELSQLASISDIQLLRDLPYLQSVITETLRLYPPVPTGGYRVSGPDGLMIAGTYIPPDTTIAAPRRIIQRLDSAFSRPNEFIPSRWTSQPELVLDKRAYAPFSQGRYGCAGKNLALREISYVTALILSKYDVAFAPDEDGTRFERDMKDAFTAAPGRLDLVFSLREK